MGEREGERKHWEERVDSTVKAGSRKERASKENLPKRSSRKHEQVSGRKNSSGRYGVLISLQVWPNLK